MAREVKLRILGDEKDLLRAFKRSSQGARGFQRDIGQASRGAVAGSGAFRTLGRSIAFASGAFLGAAGFTAAIGGAFRELNESRKVTAQTNAVLQSTGRVAGVTAEHVENLGNALLRKTGIDDEAIRSSQNLLLTFTNIRNVMGENNDIFDQASQAVLDLSVRFDKDLSSSAILVGKALQDPVRGMTALRRVGVALTKQQEAQIKALVKTGNVMGAQKVVLSELTRQTAGAAAAAGDVQPWNLLRETIRNIGADLAKSLMPQIIEVTDRLQRWFDNAENVEKVKKAFADFIAVMRQIAAATKSLVDTMGGLKNTAKLLAAAFIGMKLLRVAALLKAVGAAALVAKTGLRGVHLAALAAGYAIGKLAVEKIPYLESALRKGGADWYDWSRAATDALGLTESEADLVTAALKRVNAATKTAAASLAIFNSLSQGARNAPDNLARAARPETAADVVPPPPKGATVEQRNAWFDAMLGRRRDLVQDAKTLQAQIGALARIAGLIRERLRITKDITRRLTLEAELRDIGRQQASLRDQIAANKIEARRLALDQEQERLAKERERVAKNLERIKARQFVALGLDASGGEFIPGLKGLRKQLGQLEGAVKGTFLDTDKTKSLMARIRKVLSGGFGAVSKDVRSTIAGMLADIRRQLGEFKGPLTKGSGLDTKKLLAGIVGISPDAARELRGRLSGVNSGGRQLAGAGAPAGGGFVGARPIVVESHTTVQLDGHIVGQIISRNQQKKKRRNPPQRRGPNRGQ